MTICAIEQAAANSGAADEDLISNCIARQEAELGELMRLRDELAAAAHGPAVDNFGCRRTREKVCETEE